MASTVLQLSRDLDVPSSSKFVSEIGSETISGSGPEKPQIGWPALSDGQTGEGVFGRFLMDL